MQAATTSYGTSRFNNRRYGHGYQLLAVELVCVWRTETRVDGIAFYCGMFILSGQQVFLGIEYPLIGDGAIAVLFQGQLYRALGCLDTEREEVPLVVPTKLLRHYFRRNPDHYIDRQWYLDPYPESLGLRNTI